VLLCDTIRSVGQSRDSLEHPVWHRPFNLRFRRVNVVGNAGHFEVKPSRSRIDKTVCGKLLFLSYGHDSSLAAVALNETAHVASKKRGSCVCACVR
jgi:hypothetical protein